MRRLALLITAPYRLLGRVFADALFGPDELTGRKWPDTTATFERDHRGQTRLPATGCNFRDNNDCNRYGGLHACMCPREGM